MVHGTTILKFLRVGGRRVMLGTVVSSVARRRKVAEITDAARGRLGRVGSGEAVMVEGQGGGTVAAGRQQRARASTGSTRGGRRPFGMPQAIASQRTAACFGRRALRLGRFLANLELGRLGVGDAVLLFPLRSPVLEPNLHLR